MSATKILGISAGYHDAAVSLINNEGDILYAAHSERFSKIKNDKELASGIFDDIEMDNVKTVAYYENPAKKQLRQLYNGEGLSIPQMFTNHVIKGHLSAGESNIKNVNFLSFDHHHSHAAAGFQTSQFSKATVVVVDAVGEWDTVTIWAAEYSGRGYATYKKLWAQKLPHSIGFFYSAMTARAGLKSGGEEHIFMGLAAWGSPTAYAAMKSSLVLDSHKIMFKEKMNHGVSADFLSEFSDEDIAASAQLLLEELLDSVMTRAASFKWSDNLVYMGGVAANCVANRKLGEYFDKIWILPNPGDAGSSLGAAALAYGKRLNWINPFLGYRISGAYPVDDVIAELLRGNIVGVASGRAEFGPRALGNRSLLADPRGPDIKQRLAQVKRRQHFRPYAPVILEEFAKTYFDFPDGTSSSPYMQVVAICRYPDDYPAIVHVDNTSRVQTVSKNSTCGIRALLERWFVLTGCPMLLNTSLNVHGEPIINDLADAKRFQELYGIKVCS